MSTTITPAFRLSPDADLFEVAEGARSVIVPYLSQKFREEYVQVAVREFDSVEHINSGLSFSEFMQSSVRNLRENLNGKTGTLDKYDLLPFRRILDFQGVFLKNRVRHHTYVLFSQDALGEEGESLVLQVEGIESDFSYWNGSDSQVADIGEEEWYFRKDCWKETIDNKRGIAQQGIVVKFFEPLLSTYDLLNFKTYKGESESFVTEYLKEERFRRIVFHTYLDKLRKVYPDLDIMQTINRSWMFMNPAKELNYSKLPFFAEQELRLEDAVSFAETRINEFPLNF
jgi:hypothetical protein